MFNSKKLKARYERNRFRLLFNVTLVVLVIVGIKFIIHHLGWEIITINPLFSGVVAANVFLMGFLLNGVLSDFKESEKLPGDLAVSLENLAQEIRGIRMVNQNADTAPALILVSELSQHIMQWFNKKTRTSYLIACINELTVHFAVLEPYSQATLIARLKQEQGNLRRMITRIHTIRETSFITSGYVLAYLITFFLCLGLVLSEINDFSESIFYVTIISYFIIYLLVLIRDLDNPFGYYNKFSGEDVSLKPIEDAVHRIQELAAEESAITNNKQGVV